MLRRYSLDVRPALHIGDEGPGVFPGAGRSVSLGRFGLSYVLTTTETEVVDYAIERIREVLNKRLDHMLDRLKDEILKDLATQKEGDGEQAGMGSVTAEEDPPLR